MAEAQQVLVTKFQELKPGVKTCPKCNRIMPRLLPDYINCSDDQCPQFKPEENNTADMPAPRSYGSKSWQDILDETIASIQKLCETKGDEYKASDNDQLANFRRRAARFKGTPQELIWAIYAGKHWDAIETYIDDLWKGATRQRSEPIEGRIDDLIVYLILLKAMCAERSNTLAVAHSFCTECGSI